MNLAHPYKRQGYLKGNEAFTVWYFGNMKKNDGKRGVYINGEKKLSVGGLHLRSPLSENRLSEEKSQQQFERGPHVCLNLLTFFACLFPLRCPPPTPPHGYSEACAGMY